MKENNLINRRELLTNGLKAGAALGLGAMAMGALGSSNSFLSELFIPKALAGIPTGALDFAADPCVLTCAATLRPCYYDTGLVRRDITESSSGKVGVDDAARFPHRQRRHLRTSPNPLRRLLK